MSTATEIERAVESLTPEELAKFREWFARFDADAWDGQLERDVKAGKLDALADQALDEHRNGRTRRL